MLYRSYPLATALLCFFLLSGLSPGAVQEPEDRIIFPHELHAGEMGLECELCHIDMETAVGLDQRHLPEMDLCMSCHDGDAAPEECEVCHTVPDEPGVARATITEGLKFPHKAHLLKAVPCGQCHAGMDLLPALTQPASIGMTTCMQCHVTPISDAGCYLCHASLDNKQPVSHGMDWVETHGFAVPVGGGGDCALCHQEMDCESCHAQAQMEKKVHPANYEFLHAGDFLSFRLECSTCHAMPQECQSCHLGKGVMPLSHSNPSWVSPGSPGGGFHAPEALDNPDYCTACHNPGRDNTCLRCHGN